ncbi:MAG: hypothetical protein CUN54_06320 [Phototrophicales bacterium]|nr:MAG: hypothetical protein CUN54_06320 [Phototrophicales bacterium]
MPTSQTQQPTLIFLHIPKTGGTTFTTIIQRQYKRSEVYAYGPETALREAFDALPYDNRANYRLIHGHFGYGFHEKLPQEVVYITLLREPLARAHSHYHHVCRTPDHPFHQQAQAMSFAEFIESGILRRFDNGMTRMLAGVDEDLPFGAVSSELLTQAKTNLRDHIACFGLLECFDESIVLLRRRFGWCIVQYARANVNRERPPIPLDERRIIEQHNQYDLELYAYAQALFENSIAQQDKSFTHELAILKLLNPTFSGHRGMQSIRDIFFAV